jgi:sugar-specific transcriptional regulator TrmB
LEEAITDAIATIHKLGLTMTQAKIYVALAANDVLSISDLSKLSKVHRTDVYRVVKELEKKGLVNRIIAHPILFKAMPLEECVDTLLQKRDETECRLRKEALKLRSNFKVTTENGRNPPHSKFILIPSCRAIKEIGNAIDKTQKSAEILLSSMRFTRGIFDFSNSIKKSWSRGVKWRMIIHKKEESEAFWDGVNFFAKNSLCQIKFATDEPLNVIGIYDQEEVFIIDNPKVGLTESAALWSDNLGLINLAKDHFERVWKQGTTYRYNGKKATRNILDQI